MPSNAIAAATPLESGRPQAIQLGNVWIMAATIAHTILTEDGDEVYIALLNYEGNLEAIGPAHPDYEKRLLSGDFIGTVSRGTSVERLAGRIRDAVVRRARPT